MRGGSGVVRARLVAPHARALERKKTARIASARPPWATFPANALQYPPMHAAPVLGCNRTTMRVAEGAGGRGCGGLASARSRAALLPAPIGSRSPLFRPSLPLSPLPQKTHRRHLVVREPFQDGRHRDRFGDVKEGPDAAGRGGGREEGSEGSGMRGHSDTRRTRAGVREGRKKNNPRSFSVHSHGHRVVAHVRRLDVGQHVGHQLGERGGG